MKRNESALCVTVAFSPPEYEDSIPEEQKVRERIESLLKESPVEVSAFDLFEDLAGDSAEVEGTVRGVLTAMLAEGLVRMTPARKLEWNYALARPGTTPESKNMAVCTKKTAAAGR